MERNNIKPLKIVNNGNSFIIQNTEIDQPSTEKKQTANLGRTERRIIKINDRNSRMESEMDTDSEDSQNWLPAKSTKLQNSRKRKISEQKNNNNDFSTPLPAKWFHNIPISNSYDILDESTVTQNTTGKAVEEKKAVKPPPIYIDAEIIDPLLELLDETIGKNNYVIKQLKDNQVKVQTTTPDTFRKVINALKTKNAGYHTYQVKNEKSYKIVIRGLHPKSNTVELNEPRKSYAEVTKRAHTNTNDLRTEETSDIKELLKQSIKNTEIITTMIREQNSLLKQQTQQITTIIGLQQRIQETKAFIYTHDIDILHVSETHLTDKNYINIPHYTMYETKHPSGKAHGETAIIIKNEIKHHLHSKKENDYIQATTITLKTQETLESKLNCNIPLKTSSQIDNAVNNLTDAIQEAAWASTS
ncbi:hypothetical protein M0804_014114 [Polistes exclamans]|nr:hypothetical protein M0804_014114 [Polistes exclamans]